MKLGMEEARELAELTDRIVANLRAIDDDGSTEDSLKEMLDTTERIVSGLQTVEEYQAA
jgi:hypothetical protein